MSEQRRSGIPHSATGLPRRAPSPSSAAFSSARPSSSGGPLGTYRPASRDGSERPSGVVGGNSTTGARFGFGSTASSSTLASKPNSGSKRTASNAGLREPETPGPNGSTTKRALLTSTSAITASPSFAQRSPAYDNSMLKSEFERRELLSKQAYEKLQNEYQASGREVERFRQERLALLRQWEEANAERKEEKDSFEEQRRFLNNRVNTLQKENQELRSGIEEAQAQRAQLAQKTHEEENKQSLRITALEYELAAAKAQAEEHKEARSKVSLALQLREKEWEEDRIRLERREIDTSDSKVLAGELSALLNKVHALEGESLSLQQDNRSLRAKTESIETLKEQKRDLEERLGLIDELRRKYAEAEAKIEDLEAEKSEWNRKLSSGGDVVAFETMQSSCADVDNPIPSIQAPGPLTPDNLPIYLSTLQGAIAGLSVRSIALEERIKSIRKQCTELENSQEQETIKRRRLEEDLANEKTEKLKSAKLAETAKMEVESYVKLLDTFQEEARNQSTEYNAASAEHIQVLERRLKAMEESLEASQREADDLRKLTQGSGSISRDEREKLEKQSDAREKDLLKSLNDSRQECVELEKQCVELGRINDQLYLRVGRGEFDQSKERCLELKDNPVSQDRVIRTSTLNALRKENEDLLSQIEELSKRVSTPAAAEDGDVSMQGAMVPAQTLENQKREYDELVQTMRNRDKAFDRLKEAFGAKAMEYVAAVKALFGYDMHVISKGKVKLRSIYARTAKGTSLTFDSGDDSSDVGNMKLVGEARQGVAVGNLQDYWLGNDRFSVPCFLAALQLELYEGTTRAVRPTWEAEEDQ